MPEIVVSSKVECGLEEIARLRRFSGPPAEFWSGYIAAASGVAGADRGLLILKDNKENNWKKLGEWAQNGHADRTVLTFNRHLIEVAQRASESGTVLMAIEQAATPDLKHYGAMHLTQVTPTGCMPMWTAIPKPCSNCAIIFRTKIRVALT